ncbi:MAG: DNA-directed RNA polymerase subunit M [Thermogladius sp.]|uniref:DNA-directed RNA polymerase subunit M n=1 Tax=Thermogladius calderae TaxID=1200300 RepID=A0A7J3Y079_9CREN|nr:DNA-directed RNA polymerase subunit M [Thermogladius sp.]
MVKFCPRCGAAMFPLKKKEGGEEYYVLKCPRCGYEEKASKKDLEAYGLKYVVDSSKRTITAKATEARESSLSPDEREMLQEYYEVLLESMKEEESEEEESD